MAALDPKLRTAFAASQNSFSTKLREELRKDTIKTVEDTVKKAVDRALESPQSSVEIDTAMLPQNVAAPETIDDEQLFQLFAIYCGDVKRTALAANLTDLDVEAKALAGGWRDKIKLLIDLRTSARPGDSERGINRAVNFVQAHRWRTHLQRVMNRLMAMDDDELFEMLCGVTVDSKGNVQRKLNTRAFADMSSAMEKCHAMSYSALNDTVGERKERGDEPEQHKTAAEMHLQITRAMEQIRKQNREAAEAEAAASAKVATDTTVS